MRKYPIQLLLLVLFYLASLPAQAVETTLWYEQPASKWVEALPLGNGRMGAMVYGGVQKERLQLNEESLWAGEPLEVYPDRFRENLKTLQDLVLDGKTAEAHAFGQKNLVKKPTSFRSYEPLADLCIELKHDIETSDYRRDLNLLTGIATVQYKIGDITYKREMLLSAVDNLLAVRLSADTPGAINATVALAREKDIKLSVSADGMLKMDGQIVDIEAPEARDDNRGGSGPGGAHMKFAGRLIIKTKGGEVKANQETLVIEKADEAILLFTAATDYNLAKLNFDRSIDPGQIAEDILRKAGQKSWAEIQADHKKEHRSMMERVVLELGPSSGCMLPTDKRLAIVKKGENDPGLASLYFQYGRYILMSSSRRPGRLPANLQGIWNDQMWAPWEADYHLNINLQMNYWPADLCNLSETVEPLVDWFSLLTKKGQVTARRLFDSNGWVAYHASNPFGRTTPSASTLRSQFLNGVLDPMPGAWMAMTLWRHYEFTQDEKFLKEKAYPILKGAAEFILDNLIEDQDGFLVIVPSTSPENKYLHPETNKPLRITRGSTFHTTLIRVVFEAVIQGASILDTDIEFRGRLETALLRLPPMKVGENGTIQEWIEDYQEPDPHHRHVCHLIGLHPFSHINAKNPKLFTAARKTLERRGSGRDIGWSNAWKVNFFARLLDGEKAYAYLCRLIGQNTFPNLMDSCWPGKLFQIEGNLAGTAGITEMLLQSHGAERVLHFLPALPEAWKTGSFRGLLARGAFEIDLQWKDSQPVEAQILSLAGKEFRFEKSADLKVHDNGNDVAVHEHGSGYLFFKTSPGHRYSISF